MTERHSDAAKARTEVTILVTNHQAARLDEISAAIRRNAGRSISRSAILRAILTAAESHQAAWLHGHSEEELCHTIAAQLLGRSRG